MEEYGQEKENLFDDIYCLLSKKDCDNCSLEIESHALKHECLISFKLLFKDKLDKLKCSYEDHKESNESKLFSAETRLNDLEERRKYLQDELIKEQKISQKLTEKLNKVLLMNDEVLVNIDDPLIEEENERCMDIMNHRLKEFEQFIKRDWNLKHEKKELLYRLFYIDENCGLRSIKAEIVIKKGIKTVYEFVEDKNNKLKTDKNFEDGYIIRRINSNIMLTYQKYSGKFGFSPRDYYLLVHKQICNDNALILCTSFNDNKYEEKKGVVRANLQFGGYSLKKLEDNITLVNFFYLDDIKTNSFIAKMNLNSVASQIIDVKKMIES